MPVGQGTILHVALQHFSFNMEDPMIQMVGNFGEKCPKCPWWQDALCLQRKSSVMESPHFSKMPVFRQAC